MENRPPENNDDKLYIIIAIALMAAGALALGLSFTVLGIYALITSLLFETLAITLINLQKKKQDFKWLLYLKIGAYALLVAAMLIFVGGTVWSSQTE